MPVSVLGAENSVRENAFEAKRIENPNVLLMRATLGVDERSEEVKKATSIHAEAQDLISETLQKSGLREPEVFFTTQLVERIILPDGTAEETYSTTAIARAQSYTESNSETENSVIVYAMINYTAKLVEGSIFVECRFDKSQHRVVSPSSVSTSNMEQTNKVDNGLDVLYSNSKTIASPADSVWYSLGGPSTKFFNQTHRFQATTYVRASNGASPMVLCQVDLHSAP